jgi:hypothetical protein
LIPRHQIVIFSVLLVASLIMGVALWELREHAHQRLLAGQDSSPTSAPEVAPEVQATLIVANDSDGSLLSQLHSLPLPAEPNARARAVLAKLLDVYAAADATHPVPGGGSAVQQVFLMPAVDMSTAASASTVGGKKPVIAPADPDGPQLAVVNLLGSFAANHPSGIETEMLTVLSLCGTLHANLPRVTQVRFLVDGAVRATLAGHADLTRTYLTADAETTQGANP